MFEDPFMFPLLSSTSIFISSSVYALFIEQPAKEHAVVSQRVEFRGLNICRQQSFNVCLLPYADQSMASIVYSEAL
jgi:hypothetical protein